MTDQNPEKELQDPAEPYRVDKEIETDDQPSE